MEKNLDQLNVILEDITLKPEFVALTETWMNEEQGINSGLGVNNYTIEWGKDKFNKNGGVAIAVRSDVDYKVIDKGTRDISADYLVIEINDKNNKKGLEVKHTVMVIYRNPGRNKNAFVRDLTHLLRESYKNRKRFSIIGDWNINLDENKRTVTKMKVKMAELGYRQLIKGSTRLGKISGSRIDLWYTNILDEKIFAGTICTGVTDHYMIYAEIINESKEHKKEQNGENKRKEKTYLDENKIKSEIGRIKKEMIIQIGSPTESMSKLQEVLAEIIGKNKKIKKITNHYSCAEKNWMKPDLVQKIRKRDRLLNKRNKEIDNMKKESMTKKIFKDSKEIAACIKKAKDQHNRKEISENKDNKKKHWQIITKIMKGSVGKKESRTIKEIISNGKTYKGEESCANAINDYFIEVANNNRFNIQKALNQVRKIKNTIFLEPATETEVDNIIRIMSENKAPGEDMISMKIIKQNKDVIGPMLVEILNDSFEKGEYPDTLKNSIIKPIYKKGSRNSVENYRPIAILNSFAKIIEYAIHKRIYNFIEKEKILTENQYAYRRQRSIQDLMKEKAETINKAFEKRNIVGACYIDVKKAFDSVNRDILTKKLEHYGIRGKAGKLIESYFKNRTQTVKIGDYESEKKLTKTGIPQGSSLAPLLFILYTNDLDNNDKEVETMMYADDTALITEQKNIESVVRNLQRRLNKVIEWMEDNGLVINNEKTEFIIYISDKSKLGKEIKSAKLKVQGSEINVSDKIKYLGIVWDKNLNWKEQISEGIKKMRSLLPATRRLAKITSNETKKEIYHAIIESRIAYGIEIWGVTSKTNIEKIARVQNKLVRNLYNMEKRENTLRTYQRKRIQNVYELHLNKETKRAWQIMSEEKKSKKIEIVVKEPNADAKTREQEKYRITRERSKNSWGNKSAANRMAAILNYLEEEIKIISNPEYKARYPEEKIQNIWRQKGCQELKDKFWTY